ncbi:MAG TPA: hypothetical protein VHW23_11990, partial [Kofleriaceae bacterium]|nr:hypothetical protein [Kofleriaceae bacterium]
ALGRDMAPGLGDAFHPANVARRCRYREASAMVTAASAARRATRRLRVVGIGSARLRRRGELRRLGRLVASA